MSEKVFIGGSRRIIRFNEIIQERLREVTAEGHEVLVGDANGADKATQNYLHEIDYELVTVYYTGVECRNNIAGWKTQSVVSERKLRDFEYYAAKDFAMSKDADFGIMLWDGRSVGTVNNILNLINEGKKAVVYVPFEDDFVTVCTFPELNDVLAICPDDARNEMERKLNLSGRVSTSQGELPLEY